MAALAPRILIQPGALAASPGHVQELFPTAAAAMAAMAARLRPLPPPLIGRWLGGPGGYILLNAARHGFVPGPTPYRRRTLHDVAWVQLRRWRDCADALQPVAALLLHLAARPSLEPDADAPPAWAQFLAGAHSCFAAGYGRSPAARADLRSYLIEGIAAFLCDRPALNVADPRLEKLLAATLFHSDFTAYPAQ